ncbi:MAG TPA: hypothetical protein VHA14_11910 [Bryobacteraceae bacterium]|nr:hypothetical protein [Bryobacteraceae bacterium]
MSPAADRPDLTPGLCQQIVIDATPSPGRFTGRTQDLFQLGVVDTIQKQVHQARIQSALAKIGFQIAQGDVSSGPGVSVGDCSDSVLGNAH